MLVTKLGVKTPGASRLVVLALSFRTMHGFLYTDTGRLHPLFPCIKDRGPKSLCTIALRPTPRGQTGT